MSDERMKAILVADQYEANLAKEAGWGHNEIIIAERTKLEGRRYHDLHVTWTVMGEKWCGEIATILNMNQVRVPNGTIQIVGLPLQRRKIT